MIGLWRSRRQFLILIILVATLSSSCLYSQRAPVRGFLYRGESPAPGLGAYGYLLFTMQPDKQKHSRYEHVCDAYSRNFREINEYGRRDPSSLMITYWLLNDRRAGKSLECGQLVDNYDYATANEIASDIGTLSSMGPILVAWKQPYGSESMSDGLLLDMSDFSDEDLDRAFGIWKDRIVKDPAVWNNGFDYVRVREACRSLLQTYGGQIIKELKELQGK